MTSKRSLRIKIRILSGFVLFLTALTLLLAFAAPAQQAGRGQWPGTASALLTRQEADYRTVNTTQFLPPVAYDSGGYTASFVAVGDVNGDGKLDLVLGNECASSGCVPGGAGLGVLLGNGDGTFQTAVTYGTGGSSGPFWPVSITIADVNGDHKPDLVVANGGSNSIGVLLGNGDGTFQQAVAYGSGDFFPVSVGVADLHCARQ